MTIEQSLAKPDSKIFTEDLKNLLYLTRSDNDLDLLLRSIKRLDFLSFFKKFAFLYINLTKI
jgi:hypothetical protein